MEQEVYIDEYEVDLRDCLKLLWSGKRLLIGLVIAAVLFTWVVSSFFIEPVYESEATINLSNIGGFYSDVNSVISYIKSDRLIKPILEKKGLELSSAQLKGYINNNIEVDNPAKSKLINIKVRGSSPDMGREILNEIVKDFKNDADKYYEKIISNKDNQLYNVGQEIEEIDERIDIVEKNSDRISNLAANNTEKSILITSLNQELNLLYTQKNKLRAKSDSLSLEILNYYPMFENDRPHLPESPIKPRKVLNMAIAAVLAFMIGVFYLFFREYMKEDEEEETV